MTSRSIAVYLSWLAWYLDRAAQEQTLGLPVGAAEATGADHEHEAAPRKGERQDEVAQQRAPFDESADLLHVFSGAPDQERRKAPSACRCYADPASSADPLCHEHNLADYAALREQLLRGSRLGKRKSLRDERFDLLLLKEVEESDQILPKQGRL